MEALKAVVIGAGQAGLSAAYWLQRKGLRAWEDYVVLDANEGPGGAWRHRWPSLTFDAAHGLHPLPGLPLEAPDPHEPSSAVVSRYYGAYEREFALPVVRPARVASVTHANDDEAFLVRADDGREWLAGSTAEASPLLVRTDDSRSWVANTVISATGTWDRPHWPHYPGQETFRGRQLHTHDFRSADEFRGQRVLVVGGGTSALQFLLQLDAAGATTFWSTRRPPDFRAVTFDANWGVDVERRVNERTRAGLPPLSVVAATGLPLSAQYRAGIDSGVLVSRGPIERITPDGAVLADGAAPRLDAILWATGFRASLGHLAPLRLREPGGGVLMGDDGVSVVREPRLFLVGYGASASTIGATRAGRAAAVAAVKRLEGLREPATV
ncbi:NAD(P)-binding domain-containing protein [Sinomonas sp. ASV322]|uniref:NAD(P)-binding domain-containing protein n=1 Tax=Sinomonas sp. ASV322 TaxID=3041920 RepID=UPI0027DE47E7|nr:NAD(P)-binding domain-containing protein [Sinomonas sp. ASV322]MDQ4503611.1 NAD(P)-binding domain-containing protein [Sinomonas sp. ASV322]